MVVGAARSGLAASELLLACGAKVILNDSKSIHELNPLSEQLLSNNDCQLMLGQPAEALLPLADFLVISPGIPIAAPFVMKAFKSGMTVLGEMELAASLASQEMIAVSGTNGKTTTVSLLGEMFRQAGKSVQITGNIGFPLSSAVLNAKREDILVCEVSSFQLETVDTFHPKAAVMLNITPDHLDRHGSLQAYIDTKQRLFAKMTSGDVVVLNKDDNQVAAMAEKISVPVHWFSLKERVKPGTWLENGNLMCRQNDESIKIIQADELTIPGLHNVQNALAAAALAVAYGLPVPAISSALKRFKGVEHRIEYVKTVHGVRWINDSKGTNPDSTIKAIAAMDKPTVLLAGGYDKQVSFDSLAEVIMSCGQICAVILLGQTKTKIASSLRNIGYQQIHLVSSLEEGVQLARKIALPGQNVLFSPACSSFDMFTDYEQRGRSFKTLVFSLPDGQTK